MYQDQILTMWTHAKFTSLRMRSRSLLPSGPVKHLKKHITPVDVFFYVLEGSGVIEIGSEKQTVGKDMLVESPARIPHRWSNESASVFRVLVVKVPKPTEATKLL